MEILVIIILILLNGILSLSEMSLVSARKFKLENEVKKGNERAKIALEVSQNPTKLLSTVQIGITVIALADGLCPYDSRRSCGCTDNLFFDSFW